MRLLLPRITCIAALSASVAAFWLSGALSGQACAVTLTPHIRHIDVIRNVNEASLIVVAYVRRVRSLDCYADYRPGDRLLQLVRVDLEIETVLRGTAQPQVSYYFYYFIGAYGGPPLNRVGPGDRGVFFLVRDNGVWRSVNDMYLSYIQIFSGNRAGMRLEGKSVRRLIAEAAILPGRGMDVVLYARYFQRVLAGAVYRLVGPAQALELASQLLHGQDPVVMSAACLAVAGLFPSHGDCVEDIVADPHANEEVRGRAEKAAAVRRKRIAKETTGMLSDPSAWLEKQIADLGEEYALVTVSGFAKGRDGALAQVACRLLRQRFPERVPSSCAAEK